MVSPILHMALETLSSMSEMLIRVTVMPFSRKGLADLLCEIPKIFGLWQFVLPWLNLENAQGLGGYSFREEKVKILSIPTELERGRRSSGHGSSLTWKSPEWQLSPLPSDGGSPLLAPASPSVHTVPH